MPVKNQILRIFTKHKINYNKNWIDPEIAFDGISEVDKLVDVTDGEIYRNVLKNQKFNSNSFTFLLNIDGISLCNKSQLSIWPVILAINELPLNIRFCLQNVVIAGNNLRIYFYSFDMLFKILLNRNFSRQKTIF